MGRFFFRKKSVAIFLSPPESAPRLSAKKILETAPAEPREWMRNLTSWVMSNGRKPLRHADAGERLQAERWKIAKGYLKMGKLNAAEKQFPRLYLWNPTFHNCSNHYLRACNKLSKKNMHKLHKLHRSFEIP